jgi:hypothetical protein
MSTTTVAPAHVVERSSEAGFSLVEVLIAIVVLVFGIISVANLMVVAAANNMTANQGSGAVTVAIEEMERLKSIPFATVPLGRANRIVGEDLARDQRAVGRVHVLSKVDVVTRNTAGAPVTYFITVVATPMSALNARTEIAAGANPPTTRSQAIFTSFRTVEGQ